MCARTYVLKNLNKHNSYGFDICTSANCQVYHGMGSNKADYGPSEVSMRAVAETAGLVIKYNGRLAETPYSSSFGGASEDANYVWGTNTTTEHPYLRGVEDPYETDLNGELHRRPADAAAPEGRHGDGYLSEKPGADLLQAGQRD